MLQWAFRPILSFSDITNFTRQMAVMNRRMENSAAVSVQASFPHWLEMDASLPCIILELAHSGYVHIIYMFSSCNGLPPIVPTIRASVQCLSKRLDARRAHGAMIGNGIPALIGICAYCHSFLPSNKQLKKQLNNSHIKAAQGDLESSRLSRPFTLILGSEHRRLHYVYLAGRL